MEYLNFLAFVLFLQTSCSSIGSFNFVCSFSFGSLTTSYPNVWHFLKSVCVVFAFFFVLRPGTTHAVFCEFSEFEIRSARGERTCIERQRGLGSLVIIAVGTSYVRQLCSLTINDSIHGFHFWFHNFITFKLVVFGNSAIVCSFLIFEYFWFFEISMMFCRPPVLLVRPTLWIASFLFH